MLVVDDSAVVRDIFTRELARDPDIEVVGAVPDPYVARDEILRLAPDVVTLDVEMPRMDGLTFLRKLMRHYPLPVIIVSSLDPQRRRAGPGGPGHRGRGRHVQTRRGLCGRGYVHPTAREGQGRGHGARAQARRIRKSRPPRCACPCASTTQSVIAIGASTGGTQALQTVLSALPANTPGVVVVQHMPEHFTRSFAERLNPLRHGGQRGGRRATRCPWDGS